MRENVLNLLRNGKKLHTVLIDNYTGLLPDHILAGGNNTINEEFPNKTNVFITILNLGVGEERFTSINSVDEAIVFFENEDVQKSIDETIANKAIVGYSELQKKALSTEELLEAARFALESGVRLLELQVAAGELVRKNRN